MCRRTEEEVGPTVGLPRHRHFVGFFNVPVQAPTRDHPFYTVIPTVCDKNEIDMYFRTFRLQVNGHYQTMWFYNPTPTPISIREDHIALQMSVGMSYLATYATNN